jgi:hypothetical protein
VVRFWNPRGESVVARARRTAALSPLKVGRVGLSWRQRAQRDRRTAGHGPVPEDAAWTPARLLAVNLALLCALAALVVLLSTLLERVTQQVFFIAFILLTLFLVRRGSRLRRRGLDRLGRSVTAWAGATGCLVVVAGALSVGYVSFVPELFVFSAGWLLLLGVWKDLPVLVTGAVVLVVPAVWGAFVWDRSVVGAVVVVVVAGVYARAGAVRSGLFSALVVSGVVLVVVAAHQLTHARGDNGFDGSDLLAVTILLTVLCAVAELESWHHDWMVYATRLRGITGVVAIGLAVLAEQSQPIRSWTAATPMSAVARLAVAGAVAMIVLWVATVVRPMRPGGRLKVAAWTLVTIIELGTQLHAFSVTVLRWVAVVALAVWGLRVLRGGLRRSRAWLVVGGFAVLVVAAVPIVVSWPALWPLVLFVLAVATATAAALRLPERAFGIQPPDVPPSAAGEPDLPTAGGSGVRSPAVG